MKNKDGVEHVNKRDVAYDFDKRTCEVCHHYDYPIEDGWKCRYCGHMIGTSF